ncbi:hypothetical protein JCM5353_007665 [Sporobolomyces roseus]
MANPSFAIPAHPYPYEDFLGLVNSMPDSDPFSGVKGRLLEISKGDWNLASTKMGFVDWVIKGTEKKIAPTRALIHALEILLGDVTVKLPKHLNNVRSTLTAIEEFLKGPFYVELLRLTTLSSYTGLRCLHSSLAALTHRSWQQLGYEGLKHYVGRLEKLFKGRTTIASKGEDEDHINKIVGVHVFSLDFVYLTVLFVFRKTLCSISENIAPNNWVQFGKGSVSIPPFSSA